MKDLTVNFNTEATITTNIVAMNEILILTKYWIRFWRSTNKTDRILGEGAMLER
jgi:hypothetical protein